MYRFFIIVIFVCFSQIISAQVKVAATVDSIHMLIGDQMKVHINVQMPNGSSVKKVDLSKFDKAESIELVNIADWDTLSATNGIVLNKDLMVTSFDSGYHYIPSIPVSISANGKAQTLPTNQIPIEVRTIQTDSTYLAPIKNIIEEPFKISDVFPYALGLLGFIALLFFGRYFFKKKNQPKEVEVVPEIKRPAHEIAFEKLEQLKKDKLWQQGKIKEYQSQLTYIVREYLENRYDIQALESTTDDILPQLKNANIPDEFSPKLREMLQLADLVKFAKAEPPIEAHDRLMSYAESFVRQTKKSVLQNVEEKRV